MFSINAFLLKTQELSSPVIYSNSVQLNYEEFRKEVLKTAGILSALGLGDKDNIAIIGNSDVDFVTNLLAVWQIKAVPVLISPRLTNNEIEERFQLCISQFPCRFCRISCQVFQELKHII